ncbi:hypothetical protein [Pseudoalteromonas sp. Of7M-16]|uniref:hypothetical protein n=1 Tax=Pseudoalteromonas sp. Of7M-16 TaxID=2917756 RepID=UPI001EF656F3|nr:hypothetical protein [Pseudoalteromonas sp. Of7M-16]MCG7550903.1 hypothetical protein [Pseudoalteromonas sp. Of7M-16]
MGLSFYGFCIHTMLTVIKKKSSDVKLEAVDGGWRLYALSEEQGEFELTGPLGYVITQAFKPYLKEAQAEREELQASLEVLATEAKDSLHSSNSKDDKKWTYSFDGEKFHHGTFDSLDDALADAQMEALALDDNTTTAVFGTCTEPSNESFFPDSDEITNYMACQAEDEGGEYALDYPDASEEAELELSNALHGLLSWWCKKHEITPNFFNVEKTQKYDINTWQPIEESEA